MGDILVPPVELLVGLMSLIVPLVFFGAVVYILLLLRRLVRVQEQILAALTGSCERNAGGPE